MIFFSVSLNGGTLLSITSKVWPMLGTKLLKLLWLNYYDYDCKNSSIYIFIPPGTISLVQLFTVCFLTSMTFTHWAFSVIRKAFVYCFVGSLINFWTDSLIVTDWVFTCKTMNQANIEIGVNQKKKNKTIFLTHSGKIYNLTPIDKKNFRIQQLCRFCSEYGKEERLSCICLHELEEICLSGDDKTNMTGHKVSVEFVIRDKEKPRCRRSLCPAELGLTFVVVNMLESQYTHTRVQRQTNFKTLCIYSTRVSQPRWVAD